MSASSRLRDLARRHRDLVVVTLAALAVRLVWNLVVHPPLAYAFSDMGGYLERAQTSIDHPGQRLGYFTLFPWGTHVLVMLVKRASGAAAALGVTYAVLGALAVSYGFLLARRLTRSVGLARAVGAVLVVYYPWISLGGYVLSEPPFALCLGAVAYHGLALADRGRARDAWAFGVALALGAAFRPQLLLALPLYGACWALRRGAFGRLRPAHLAGALAPLAVVLALSAARMEFHTGKLGLISNNGPLNYAFGRCHALTITAVAPDRRSGYSPPSLGALAAHEKEHPGSPFRLRPALGPALQVDGHIWDAEPFEKLAARCVAKTGWGEQLAGAATHVALLWFFNVPWPDQGQRPPFRRMMAVASVLHGVVVLPPALVALGLAFRRRRARLLLVALHVFALVGVAALYFGDARLRAPYDGILIVLAATTYAGAYRWARRRQARIRSASRK